MNQNNLSYYYITLDTYIYTNKTHNIHHGQTLYDPSSPLLILYKRSHALSLPLSTLFLQTINTLIRILKCQLSLSMYISSAYYKQILVYNPSRIHKVSAGCFQSCLQALPKKIFLPIPAQAQWYDRSNYLWSVKTWPSKEIRPWTYLD